MDPEFTIAAISDIHIEKYSIEESFFNNVNGNADLLVVGGDMNNGKDEEVNLFLKLVSNVRVPIVVIFGNHDCDANNLIKIKERLSENPLIKILDGEYTEYVLHEKILGIAGVKGYGGGFAPHRIVSRGEVATKSFVEEEDREVEKLRIALSKMEQSSPDFRLVLTHWAAFEETIEGEPKELYVVLGSSRLGDAIMEIGPQLALSGHAHHGAAGIKKARGEVSACNIAYRVNDGKMLLFDFFLDGNVLQRYSESQ